MSQTQKRIPYDRLGLSRAQCDTLLCHQRRTVPNSESLAVYLRSEEGVKALARVVKATRNDPKLCGFILSMTDRVLRELSEEEARKKAFEKKYRRSTFGMF